MDIRVDHPYRAIDMLTPIKKTIHVLSLSPTIIDSDEYMFFTFSLHVFNYPLVFFRRHIIYRGFIYIIYISVIKN